MAEVDSRVIAKKYGSQKKIKASARPSPTAEIDRCSGKVYLRCCV